MMKPSPIIESQGWRLKERPIDLASQVYRSFIALVRCKNRAEGLVVNRFSLSYDLSWVKGCWWKGQDENVGLHHLMAVYLCFTLLCIPVAAPFPPHLILHTLETDSACFTLKLLEKEKPKRKKVVYFKLSPSFDMAKHCSTDSHSWCMSGGRA